MNRDVVLTLRLPCQHGRYGWHTFPLEHTEDPLWRKNCPGGVAIVTLCVTCKGSGKSGKGKVELTEKGAGVAWSSCDDCVDGLVATSGRIIQWCDEHDQKRMVGQFGDVCLLWIAIEDDGDKGDLRCPFGYRWLSDRIEEQ